MTGHTELPWFLADPVDDCMVVRSMKGELVFALGVNPKDPKQSESVANAELIIRAVNLLPFSARLENNLNRSIEILKSMRETAQMLSDENERLHTLINAMKNQETIQ